MSQLNGSGGVLHRKLVVGVEFTANTAQANRAMEDLAKRADTVAANMTKAQQAASQLTYVGGSRVIGPAPPPPGPPGPPPPNVKGSLSDQFLQVAGATAAVQTVAGLADGMVRLARSSGTARQAVEEFTSAVPYLGSALQSVANVAYGAIDLYKTGMGDRRRSEEKIADRLRLAVGEQLYGTNLARDAALAGVDLSAAMRADQVNLGREFLTPGLAGAALVGGVFEQTDPRIQEARDAARRAQRDRTIASLAYTRTLSPLDRAEARSRQQFNAAGEGGLMGERNLAEQTAEVLRLRGVVGKSPSYQVEFDTARKELASKVGKGEADLANFEQQLNEARQRSVDLARADYELAKARTGEMRAQVAVLAEQEAKARAADRSFGAMMPHEQDLLLQDVRQFKEVGFQALTPEQKARLLGNAVTGDFFGREAEQLGEGSDVLKEIRRLLGLQDAKTLQDARVKLESDVRVKVEVDEQKLTEAMDKALKTFDERLKDIIVKRAALAEARATLEKTQNNAAQK